MAIDGWTKRKSKRNEKVKRRVESTMIQWIASQSARRHSLECPDFTFCNNFDVFISIECDNLHTHVLHAHALTIHCPTKMYKLNCARYCANVSTQIRSKPHLAIPLNAHSSILGVYAPYTTLSQTFILFSLCWNADVFDTFWTPTIHYMMYATLMNEFLRPNSGRTRWFWAFQMFDKTPATPDNKDYD